MSSWLALPVRVLVWVSMWLRLCVVSSHSQMIPKPGLSISTNTIIYSGLKHSFNRSLLTCNDVFIVAETQPTLMIGYGGPGGAPAPAGAYTVGGMPSYQGYSM